MHDALALSLSALASAYLGQCWWLRQGLLRAHRSIQNLPDKTHFVIDKKRISVIIAARNEEKNIRSCLDSVLNQSIPSNAFSVLIVDDRSTDSTAAIVSDAMTRHPNLSLLSITETPSGISPKKHAVSQGVAQTTGEIVVFTDADCTVPRDWLATILSRFTTTTGMVQGITKYAADPSIPRWLFGLQAVDFLSHGIVAASGIGAGLPINSNANNFAFRREAFTDAKGYGSAESVISGDDDLLMQRIWKSGKWKVVYNTDVRGAVETAASPTLRAVLEQRKRWASKTVHYHPQQAGFLAIIFLLYCITTALLIAGLFIHPLFIAGSLLLFVKVLGELQLMIPGTRIFGATALRGWIVPASIIHLPLVLYAVFGGVFGKFSWKDQGFKRRAE